MVKTTIKETTEKFDKDGKLIERTVREEATEDDTVYTYPTYTPCYGNWTPGEVTCTTDVTSNVIDTDIINKPKKETKKRTYTKREDKKVEEKIDKKEETEDPDDILESLFED